MKRQLYLQVCRRQRKTQVLKGQEFSMRHIQY